MEPSIDQINKILVVGSGAMGSQIGMVCALAGYDVTLQDVDEDMLKKAQEQLESRMRRNVEKSRIEQDEVDAAFSRMTFTTDLEDAASGADYVIEAVVEKLDVKRDIFARLDEVGPEHAILATNSSTIVSSRIADATSRPDRVCNMHLGDWGREREAKEIGCREVREGGAGAQDRQGLVRVRRAGAVGLMREDLSLGRLCSLGTACAVPA